MPAYFPPLCLHTPYFASFLTFFLSPLPVLGELSDIPPVLWQQGLWAKAPARDFPAPYPPFFSSLHPYPSLSSLHFIIFHLPSWFCFRIFALACVWLDLVFVRCRVLALPNLQNIWQPSAKTRNKNKPNTKTTQHTQNKQDNRGTQTARWKRMKPMRSNTHTLGLLLSEIAFFPGLIGVCRNHKCCLFHSVDTIYYQLASNCCYNAWKDVGRVTQAELHSSLSLLIRLSSHPQEQDK